MNILINGKDEMVDEGTSVRDLLSRMDLAPVRVAVEINEDLVARRSFADTSIREGDRIEIVTFVGGG